MKECWICIVELEEDGKPMRSIPSGFDAPLRDAVEGILEDNNIIYKHIYSGWGFPPSQLNKILNVWTKYNISDSQFATDLIKGDKLRDKEDEDQQK